MYNLKTRIILFILSAVVIAACQDNNLAEVSPSPLEADAVSLSATGFIANDDNDTANLDKVELYMMRGSSSAVGNVRLQIKSGNHVMASSELPVASIPTTSSWVAFTFTEKVHLTLNFTYRIEVIRSHPSVGAGGLVYWRTSLTNPYPAGVSDWSATSDYAFRTYINGALDDEQAISTTVVPVSSTTPRWQQFVAHWK
jgi:hypothetical protein